MTKHFLYMSLLCLMAMLSGCSVDDGVSSTMNPQLDADLHPVLTFKGHHDNYWIGIGSELPDYLVNFDSDFQVVIHKLRVQRARCQRGHVSSGEGILLDRCRLVKDITDRRRAESDEYHDKSNGKDDLAPQ